MQDQPVRRRLAAILSADAVGFTRLMASDEVVTVRTLSACREKIVELVSTHRGRVVDSLGDNVLAEFPSATDAVSCGVEIQTGVGELNQALSTEARMLFRVGVHLGEVMVEGDRIYGDGVNVASRIEALARPGELAISSDVHAQIASKLALPFEDLGLQSLKNFPKRVRVFRIPLAEDRDVAQTRRRRPVPVGLAAVALSASLAGLVAWWWSAETSTELVGGGIQSIAVLPLENLSGSPDQEYFADGMTETLIGELAQLGSIRVISRTSVMQYKGATKSLPQIASELNVDAVIEGSVARSDDRVRITAQLIDARSDDHLWIGRYDRDVRDVLMLQAEVAREIARQVQLELAPDQTQRLAKVRHIDAMAHDKYLWGLYYLRTLPTRDLESALNAFGEAAAIDPNYAEAFVGIAQSHLARALLPSRRISPSQAFPEARTAAERALAIDSNLAAAHAALGWVELLYDWDRDSAAASFRRALELSPNDLAGLSGYAAYLSSDARHEEAVDLARRAAEVAPLDPAVRYELALTLGRARRYEEAIEQSERVLRVDPTYWDAYGWSSWLPHLRNDELNLAVDDFERWRSRSTDSDSEWSEARSVYAREGIDAFWRRWLGQLDQLSEESDPYLTAVLHANIGESDAAFDWLGVCLEERAPALAFIRVDPALDPLREDPRFDELLRKLLRRA